MGIMGMGFYADSLMMLALGGACSLIISQTMGMALLALAISLLSYVIPGRWKKLLSWGTIILLGAYAVTGIPLLSLLSSSSALLASMVVTKSSPHRSLTFLESILWAISLIVFPMVKAHAALAFQLQLLLLCMVLASGVCIPTGAPIEKQSKPFPLCLLLLLFWVLFRSQLFPYTLPWRNV